MITINKISNGYIINRDKSPSECRIYKDSELESMFTYILQDLTGNSPYFDKDMFGEVKINLDIEKRLQLVIPGQLIPYNKT